MRIPTRVLEVLDELAHWATSKICNKLAHRTSGAEFLVCGCSLREDIEVICETHANQLLM